MPPEKNMPRAQESKKGAPPAFTAEATAPKNTSPSARAAQKNAAVQPAPRKYLVERARFHHGSLIVSFKGVHSRNDAELLRQHSVLVPKSRLAPLEDDEVYLLDLPGLTVLSVDQESGGEKEIGVIRSVDIPSGQELWTILTPDGKEVLFPAVDEFVLDIDLDANTARIAPPPGLLELYLGQE